MTNVTSLLPQAIARYFSSSSGADDTQLPDPDTFDDEDVARVRRHLEIAERRGEEERLVEVAGTESGGFEVVVVNDDMPLLVEAVLASVEAHDLVVSRIDHPVVQVVRSADGVLADFVSEDPTAVESWIFVVALSRQPDFDAEALRRDLVEVIGRVADVDRDAATMRETLTRLAAECAAAPVGAEGGLLVGDRQEYAHLLEWFSGNHFLPLGYARVSIDGGDIGRPLGIWCTDTVASDFPVATRQPLLPVVSRAYLETGIQRSDFPTLLQIPAFDNDGVHTGEHRFVGTFTPSGLHQTVLDVPVLRAKVNGVLSRARVDEDSYAGQAMLELLQNYPIVEMFASTDSELSRRIDEMLDAVATRSLRLFVRTDPGGGMASALVYLPRDRYNTQTRLQLQSELLRALGGTAIEYTARVSEMPLALLQVLVRVDADIVRSIGSVDTGSEQHLRMQARLADIIRSWDERVRELGRDAAESTDTSWPDGGVDAVLRMLPSLPDDYKEQRNPREALADLIHVTQLAPGDVTVTLGRVLDDADVDESEVTLAGGASEGRDLRTERWTFTLYLCDETATLTDVLPVLHSLGLDVLDEHPYHLVRGDGSSCWAYEFGVRLTEGMTIDMSSLADLESRFTEAFGQLWRRNAEVDAINELVIRCGLDWRSAAMLRAYGRYLRQCGFAYTTTHVAAVLGDHPAVARGLVELFAASFDPDSADDDRRQVALTALRREVGSVISLDADRILSAFAAVVTATSRTNFYVPGDDGGHRAVMSFKLRPREIPQAPQPRPMHEIFVYSPRVEGVHLRFGMVARGGLRWSDRREDFRTEILGLVKAQAVKNAVIVPVGAKGGFVVKRPPAATDDATTDREAQRSEGIACYRAFIAGLLDVTDNIDRQRGTVLPARSVVRRDGDDPYLVVAADKGTASFSDIANDVAADYGFWLGDGFASGGSAGYDHKEMGITARGAWESVKRHFREMGVDTQSQDFTVVGVGDMSGDVFGNGMLLSEHIRLVAAFDHRHVFVDPTPDAATSFGERARLFDLPRSSWADYDPALISRGGGVWSRHQKSIPVSDEMRDALGLDGGVTELSPPELIRAVLLAPVDLLWNGGIGTYIKASSESDADVGDKANDAIRVNGDELRVKVIGEGGNLGVTELGRVEFDLCGGHVNTDAMDNSAGVDCSDHEVNIKILLDAAVSSGDLDADHRTDLLDSMTGEVADLVLADNISQNSELGFCRTYSQERVDVHVRQLADLADTYDVDLHLEALPEPAELRKRFAGDLHRGLTSPELATLMAHVKLATKSDLLVTDLPDNDVFDERLARYFPVPLRTRFGTGIRAHRLRREIVTTTLVNDVVDKAGTTHLFRLREGAGASTEEGVRAYVVASAVFGLDELFERVVHAAAPVTMIDEMTLYARRLLFRASRWLLAFRPQPLAMAAEITRYRTRVTELSALLDSWMGASSALDVDQRVEHYQQAGVPQDLAHDVAIGLHRFCLLDIIDAAEIADYDPVEVGEVYFAVMEHFGIEELLTSVSDLEYGDRWHALARLALRDDMHGALRAITLKILEIGEPDESAGEMIAEWESSQSSRLSRMRTMLTDINDLADPDLATLSVAARQLRSVIR